MDYENMAITVSQLNRYIKDKIADDENLGNIFVKGEISNFKNHYTGHSMLYRKTAVLKYLPIPARKHSGRCPDRSDS